MNEKGILEGQYALVSGSSRAIGRATAEILAEHGCNVAVAARSAEETRGVALEIRRRFGVQTFGADCDVSQQQSVHEFFRKFRRWSGDRLDILVCNAGYRLVPEIWNTPLDKIPPPELETWHLQIFRTDTLGSVFCTFEALPLMIAAKQGSIVYVSSTPALTGFQGTPYTVAKAGILGLMKDVAREYGKYNVRANALALGNIATPATLAQFDPKTRKRLEQEAPLQRWGKPEEVGRAVLFLASNLSSFVTGQTLVVDGGTVSR